MNEQLQSKLVEILAGIQSATKAAGDFALAELPDIAQSYVVFGRAVATAHSIAWLFIFIGCLYAALARGFFSKAPNTEMHGYDFGWSEGRVVAAMFGTAGSAISFGILSIAASNAALVWLAPKVWLLKELASLIK